MGLVTQPVRCSDWIDLVRRARLSRTTYAVAMTLASYADWTTGTGAHPGIARLAWDSKLSYKVVYACLAELRRYGLIARTAHGRAALTADEYRLTFPDGDEALALDVPTPAQADIAIMRMGEAHRRAPRTTHGSGGTEIPQEVDSPVDNSPVPPTGAVVQVAEEELRTTHGSGATESCTTDASDAVPPTGRPPNTHEHPVTTNTHPEGDLGVTVTVPSEPDQDQMEDESDSHSENPDPEARWIGTAKVEHPEGKCAHRLPGRHRDDGWPSCALCRVEALRSPTTAMPALAKVIPMPIRDSA